VFYADDAFSGLHIMEDLTTENAARDTRLKEGRTVKEYAKAAAVDDETGPVFAERSAVVTDAPHIPAPLFWVVHVRKDYDLREVFHYINETALFKNQWQLKTASQSDYVRLVEQRFRPVLTQLREEVLQSGLFTPAVVYGYFPAQSDGNDVIVYEPPRAKSRPLPPEVSRFALLLRVSGLPKPGRSDEVVRSSQTRRKRWGAVNFRFPAGTGAVDFGDRGASPDGQVFCGVGIPLLGLVVSLAVMVSIYEALVSDVTGHGPLCGRIPGGWGAKSSSATAASNSAVVRLRFQKTIRRSRSR
jgi:hypothetical protein